MPVHAVVLHALALVLFVAGARKILDPAPVSASLRSAGLPSARVLGRLLGAGEVAAAAAVLLVGGVVSAAALGLLYLGFLAFIVANRVRGADVPCGCFGDSAEPPTPAHFVVNAAGAVVGAVAVAVPVDGAAAWLDEGAAGVAALVLVAVAAGLTIALLEVVPRVAGGSRHRHDDVPTFALKERR